ncbi:DNA-binding NarL/FixJ family response regulator [Flavobacterium arsenatis]|uniref:DNA-binding NarL/FixJ family response regulator n=1 Tax=Flavobacterium arsenatis TaxID=1484332 RepID=A0ABU1TTT6_9FLAO|nr:response regulator [Flavobacterium arsenatis]MDR6969300.1 DNA-binding NarL/FixJ family response regulator [Flavobacterium arsenatis]
MFKKILIAEDIDSTGFGLITVLEKLHHAEIVHAKYCDDALLKIRKANLDGLPFGLLITDLSFEADHRQTILANGEDLIKAVKEHQPSLKIIAYSIEERTYKIKYLLEDLDIDAFVWKGRESSGEVVRAISTIFKGGEKYLSPRFNHILHPTTLLEIGDYDIQLIKFLSEGLTVAEIGERFKDEGKSAKSSSSIEKHISKLKLYFKAKNSIHLISIAKDLGLV